jgi:hypothetical protein
MDDILILYICSQWMFLLVCTNQEHYSLSGRRWLEPHIDYDPDFREQQKATYLLVTSDVFFLNSFVERK